MSDEEDIILADLSDNNVGKSSTPKYLVGSIAAC